MARIRTLKPEFWGDERFAECSARTRLTFLGLLSACCDDEGRTRAHPKFIKASVYPYDDGVSAADVESDVDALERIGRVRRYVVGGETFLEVINFKRHQKIDKPTASKLPAPPTIESLRPPRTLAEHSTNGSRAVAEPSAPVSGRG